MADAPPHPAPVSAAVPVLEAIAAVRLVPILTLATAAAAPALGRALRAGGLPCVEVTLRTPAAIAAIRAMAADPELIVGAGTVLTPAQVEAAVAAGARFIVSPGFDPDVVEACGRLGVPAIPGVATATEIQMAVRAGLGVVKLFPAEAIGGVGILETLSAPVPGLRFIPTGGITPENARRYLEHPAVLAVGGSWIAPSALIETGRFDEIARIARDAVTLAAAAGRGR